MRIPAPRQALVDMRAMRLVNPLPTHQTRQQLCRRVGEKQTIESEPGPNSGGSVRPGQERRRGKRKANEAAAHVTHEYFRRREIPNEETGRRPRQREQRQLHMVSNTSCADK